MQKYRIIMHTLAARFQTRQYRFCGYYHQIPVETGKWIGVCVKDLRV